MEIITKESPKVPPKVDLSCTDAEEQIVINELHPEQKVEIGKQLPNAFKARLKELLGAYKDIFAWTYSDMTGVPKILMIDGKPFDTEHKLNEFKHIEPVKQKRRSLTLEKNTTIYKEVNEVVQAGMLRVVRHQTWVANPVMVVRHQMYVDFANINKACPKDYYPPPEITRKVESLSEFRLKCSLESYKGYHQIRVAEEDEEKTAFYAGKDVYYYKKMPFDLKNAGATYQRLVYQAFNKQIGRNLEASIDYMVIKIRAEKELLFEIQETFDQLRVINMKLNPKKCSFGIEKEQFLEYLFVMQRTKNNPSRIEAIKGSQALKPPKEVQSLRDRLNALSRFLSKCVNQLLPFFKTLKERTDEKAF